MALITRFSRLLRADAHAVLDQIEDPQAVLRQAVRDMQTEVQTGSQRIELMQQEATRLQRQINDAGQASDRFGGQLDDALRAGRDDLARSVIRQRLQQKQLIESLESQLETASGALERAQTAHRAQQAELENMQQKLGILGQTEFTSCGSSPSAVGITDEQVELELVREKNDRSCA